MTETYNKSYSTDFSSNFDSDQFTSEIIASSIVTALVSVDQSGDTISIIFNDTLTATDAETLDTLVSDHTPVLKPGSNKDTWTINKTITTTSYEKVGLFVFPGDLIRELTHIKCIASMNTGTTSYSIRIVDKTGPAKIAEGTFSNTVDSVNDLGTVSNVPGVESVFDVSIKITGTGSATIGSIIIYYN